MKKCRKCNEEKKNSEFYSGRRVCKSCTKKRVSDYQKKNIEKCREWRANFYSRHREELKNKRVSYYKKYPWRLTYKYIISRCRSGNRESYKKLEVSITSEDLKGIWFRDRAYSMIRPSIDRGDTYKGYTKENCQYIEYDENMKRSKNQDFRNA